ncbi:MAG: rhomboid family intramembrane serine protease [Opitutaceae bacterium]|nr:rhomboid family intramembrane serine protease [Opitutaceae bacterium]
MTPRQRLNRFLEAVAIPNLTLYLVVAQALVFVGLMAGAFSPNALVLVPAAVLEGQWWRLVSFMFQPVSMSPIFALFAFLFLYLLGNGLEQTWGTVRFNLFIFTGWALTVAVSFLTPMQVTTNAFLLGGITLAFAWLAPNFEILLLVIPVRIKWLALFYLVLDLYLCAVNGWNVRLAFAASIATLGLFIGRDVFAALQGRSRRLSHAQRMRPTEPDAPRHICVICGKNSNTHPDLDFRYCSKCAGEQCYCPDHIRNHQHVVGEAESPAEKK